MKQLIALTLASMPLIAWILQYYSSRKNSRLNLFKQHWACFKGDFIFVPIGFLFIYSIRPNFLICLFFVFGLITNLLAHKMWARKNKERKSESHFFYKDSDKLNLGGYAHLIFSTILIALILSYLLFEPLSPIIFIGLCLVFTVGVFMLVSSYKIHSKIDKFDLIEGIGLMGASLIRILFLSLS